MRPSTFMLCPQNTARRGMALVITLGILVLVFAMAVAFLGSVVTERATSARHAAGISTRHLGDMAVNLVQAQIQNASTQTDGATPKAWASQPGLVRTFRQDGSLDLAYKLYSDTAMTTTNTVDAAAFAAALATWKADTAHFTDLNAPVSVDRNHDNTVGIDERDFPIVAPAGIGSGGGPSPVIDGFAVHNAPSATAEQPIPMPTRWLYVLRDGTLAAPAGSGSTATIAGATGDNPIVGRIAFWTDDETSKLNINTAAHGFPWDIPRVMAQDEILPFAKYQPTIREFQRYPGHPATTSLAPVFGHLFGVAPGQADPYAAFFGTPEHNFANFIYGLTPRIGPGGSVFGTQMALDPVTLDTDHLYASPDELLFTPGRASRASGTNPLTKDDLREARFFLTAHSRAPEVNLFQRPRVSMWPVNNGANGKLPSSPDRLLAFCSTINGIPYYFQRSEPDDPGADIQIAENTALRDYLRSLMSQPFPGFGSGRFSGKYGTTEVNQIVTEMLDYIRASNLMPVDDYGGTKFSTDVTGQNHSGTPNPDGVGTRGGQVSPIRDGDTMGFGRIATINKAVLHFYVSDIKDHNDASLVPKRSVPTTGAYNNAPNVYLAPLSTRPAASLPPNATPDYDLETRAVLYFDFFDPMAGYPVSDYNFDLLVRFGGTWAVRRSGEPFQALGFPSGETRVPFRYDGYHGYDFNIDVSAPGFSSSLPPRVRGTTSAYRIGGGRSILSPMLGFLGVDPAFSDTVNNISGAAGADGFPDLYQLISQPVRIHQTMTPVMTSGTVSQFQNAPNAYLPGTPYDSNFDDRFEFSGGTVEVKLVVNASGGANPASDHVIQTFTFDFPGFTKPMPAYAPEGPNQLKQIFVDSNFSYRVTGVHGGGAATWLTQPGDIIVSLETAYGDSRLVAAKPTLTTDQTYTGGRASGDFVPHENYQTNLSAEDPSTRHAFSFRVYAHNYYIGGSPFGSHNPGGPGHPRFGVFHSSLPSYGRNAQPNLPSRFRTSGVPVFTLSGGTGTFPPDYDQGPGYMEDGPYLGRADEGAVITTSTLNNWPWQAAGLVASTGDQDTFYSPNKQMPGAGKFGSLPTGVISGNPWQTLLFRPDPNGTHPGAQPPPDYLLLDLFWMPVVEPYAISEPFSTAGKINLNHQIVPFSYINRDTALRGLLLKEEIPAVPDNTLGAPPANDAQSYKVVAAAAALKPSLDTRNPISLTETLKGINARFAGGGAYLSEAEFCTVPLVPAGQSYADDFAYNSTWWENRLATGDNLREKPYTNLITRLTTRSNSYTVHYRVQTLGKQPGSDPAIWDEEKDQISAEYRGSSTIERFINPNLDIASWTTASEAPSLGPFYQWRTLNTTQFAP